MKNTYKHLLLPLALIFALASCSIEKKHYSAGYHIEWKNFKPKPEKAAIARVKTPANSTIPGNIAAVTQATFNTADATPMPANYLASTTDAMSFITALQTKPARTSELKGAKATAKAAHTARAMVAKAVEKMPLHKSPKTNPPAADDMLLLLIILSFLMPFLAVGLATDWNVKKVIIAVILSCLFWLPGVIYALLVVTGSV